MSVEQISNQDYLQGVITKPETLPKKVLLPHEHIAVEKTIQELQAAFDVLIDHKASVTGGDDWHDGAFRATDSDAKVLAERMNTIKPFTDASVVGYPEASDNRVSLGSRVIVRQHGVSFPIDIVGYRDGYPEGLHDVDSQEEVMVVSPEAPITRTIMGKQTGDTLSYEVDGRSYHVEIKSINQHATRYFMHVAGVEVGQLTAHEVEA